MFVRYGKWPIARSFKPLWQRSHAAEFCVGRQEVLKILPCIFTKPILTLIALLTFLLLRPLKAAPPDGFINAGVGSVDITPTEPMVLAGSPSRLKSTSVSSRLYARALVLSDGKQKIAIVTLDTLDGHQPKVPYPAVEVSAKFDASLCKRDTAIATGSVMAAGIILPAVHPFCSREQNLPLTDHRWQFLVAYRALRRSARITRLR